MEVQSVKHLVWQFIIFLVNWLCLLFSIKIWVYLCAVGYVPIFVGYTIAIIAGIIGVLANLTFPCTIYDKQIIRYLKIFSIVDRICKHFTRHKLSQGFGHPALLILYFCLYLFHNPIIEIANHLLYHVIWLIFAIASLQFDIRRIATIRFRSK